MEIKKVDTDFSDDEENSKKSFPDIKMDDKKNKIITVHSDKKKGCKNCDGLCCQKNKSVETRTDANDISNISS